MDREKLRQAGIDYDEGLSRFSGRQELYEKYLKRFKDDENFAILQERLKEQNVEEAFRVAHTLKGVAGNLSINEFYRDICKIVEVLRAGSMEGTETIMNHLQEEYGEIIEVLD